MAVPGVLDTAKLDIYASYMSNICIRIYAYVRERREKGGREKERGIRGGEIYPYDVTLSKVGIDGDYTRFSEITSCLGSFQCTMRRLIVSTYR